MGNMIEVPTETCGDGANGRTLDENLTILAAESKCLLLRVDRRVEHELEPIGNVCTTDTVHESHHGSRILLYFTRRIHNINGIVLIIYHNCPGVARDFCSCHCINIKVFNRNNCS